MSIFKDRIIQISILSVFFIVVGVIVANYMRKSKEQDNIIAELKAKNDSVRLVRDTIRIEKEKVITKWRTRNETEIRYIYLSDDITQLIIRDSLRTRYNQGR
jgi:hypothetical protein